MADYLLPLEGSTVSDLVNGILLLTSRWLANCDSINIEDTGYPALGKTIEMYPGLEMSAYLNFSF